MCVEAAVCYAMGEPHGAEPTCVDEEIRNFKINLNDCNGWPNNKARGNGMMALAVAQLGSAGVKSVGKFSDALLSEIVKTFIPWAFKLFCEEAQAELDFKSWSDFKAKKDDLIDLSVWQLHEYDVYDFQNLDFIDTLVSKENWHEALLRIADAGLTALKLVEAPGCKYLKLVPKENMPKALIQALKHKTNKK
jgi:hypothetical protein